MPIRVVLCEKTSELLKQFKKELKLQYPYLSVSYSSLAAWIVKTRLEKGIDKKDIASIEKEFFNTKRYLKNLIVSDQNLNDAIKKLKQLEPKKRTPPSKSA